MIKRLIFFLFLSSIIGFMLFSIFQRLGEQSKVYLQPFDYFPSNPALFIEVEDFSKTLHNFFETNMIWSKFEEISKNHNQSHLEKIRNVLSDSAYNEIFNHGTTNIAFYNDENDLSWIIAKNIYKKNLYIDSTLFNNQFFKVNYPFLVISNSKNLIETFTDNYKNLDKKIIYNNISDKMRFSSQMSNLSCLVDVNLFTNVLDNLFNNNLSFSKKINSKRWLQFDIDYSPNSIKIVGITNFDSSMVLHEPVFYSFNDWLPENIELLEKNIFELPIDSSNVKVDIKTLKLKFNDDILENKHELMVLECPIDDLDFNTIGKLFFKDSSSEFIFNKLNSNLDTSKLTDLFPDFIFKNKSAFIKDNYLIISTPESKKEFDISISQKNEQSLDNYIFRKKENEEFDQAHSHFSYHSSNELLNNFYSSTVKADSIMLDVIKSIGGVSWTVNNYNNREHHGIKIKKFFPKKVDKKILWKLSIPNVIWGPYALKNHRTNTKDILVQDTENTIYLISAGGKVKWSKNLESKILGGVHQIDIYKNSKFQMIFNTSSKLHIIDILGNEIEKFPISFDYVATNPVSILDYDNLKDYRFLVAGNNLKIYNYNMEGRSVSGWTNPVINSVVNRSFSHFSINGIDYILSLESSGVIKLFNRRGGERYKINSKIRVSDLAKLQILKSYSIDSTALVFEDSLNGISKITLGGAISKIHRQEKDSINNNFANWEIYSIDQLNKVNYGLRGKRNLKIRDQSKEFFEFNFNYDYQVINDIKLGKYLLVMNKNTKEVQLIDSKYNINPNLFRASEMTCIDDINNDNSKELITVINNNVIVCYQIPSLN
jgi:hypothetical protein